MADGLGAGRVMLRNNPMNSNNGPRWAWLAKTALGVAGTVIIGIASISAALLWDLRSEIRELRAEISETARNAAESLVKADALRAELDWRVQQAETDHARFMSRIEVEAMIREAWSDWTRRDTRFDRKREAGVP